MRTFLITGFGFGVRKRARIIQKLRASALLLASSVNCISFVFNVVFHHGGAISVDAPIGHLFEMFEVAEDGHASYTGVLYGFILAPSGRRCIDQPGTACSHR